MAVYMSLIAVLQAFLKDIKLCTGIKYSNTNVVLIKIVK